MGLQHVAGCASKPWRAPYPMVMWAVILGGGTAISIGVAYLYRIDDPRIHSILVALMAGFLGVVLFMM